jgi:hypothetical protein
MDPFEVTRHLLVHTVEIAAGQPGTDSLRALAVTVLVERARPTIVEQADVG